jgi:hypothetical protein
MKSCWFYRIFNKISGFFISQQVVTPTTTQGLKNTSYGQIAKCLLNNQNNQQPPENTVPFAADDVD